MKPRRILIFSLSYFPRLVGGAEVAVKEITDRIPPSEIEFDMVTLGDGSSPKEEKIGNVRVHRVFKSAGFLQKTLFPFAAYFKGRKLSYRTRCDCIWAVMAGHAGFAALLLKLTNRNIPMLLTLQEGAGFELREGIFRPLGKPIFERADRIQAISNYLAGWARTMGASCPIDVVPNGADLELFAREVTPAEKDFISRKLCKKESDIFLVTTSRLVEKNAIGDVISSLQHLPQSVKFIVLGTGPLEPDLKHLSLKLGLNYTDEPPINQGNRVHFMGYVAHKDMPQYFAVSDIFVRPSITEGQGASFIEAMAAGLPVIATGVGGIPDFLTDGETGLICEVGNPHSIAQKVEKFLKDRESRDYIVKKARALVKDKYQWKKIAADMQRVFEKTIHG